ncbi:hypothetical protein [Sphingobacterium litopenaei]
MYAQGMSTRNIKIYIREMYAMEMAAIAVTYL